MHNIDFYVGYSSGLVDIRILIPDWEKNGPIINVTSLTFVFSETYPWYYFTTIKKVKEMNLD